MFLILGIPSITHMPLNLRTINRTCHHLMEMPHALEWGGSAGRCWSLEGVIWAGIFLFHALHHAAAKFIPLGCHFAPSHPLIIPLLASLFISHKMWSAWLHLEGPSKLRLPSRSSIIHRKCHVSALMGHWCQLRCSLVNISNKHFGVFSHAASVEAVAHLCGAASLPSIRHCWKLSLTRLPVTVPRQWGCCLSAVLPTLCFITPISSLVVCLFLTLSGFKILSFFFFFFFLSPLTSYRARQKGLLVRDS